VAYVRFASVYRRFDDIDAFMDELKNLVQAERGRVSPLPTTSAESLQRSLSELVEDEDD
jgi:hypothetical protein